MKTFVKKYREMIMYMLCGIPTVATSVGGYFILAHLNISTAICGVVSQLASIVVAYLTNRRWVFQHKHHGKRAVMTEFMEFLIFRIITGILDVAAMVVFVDMWHLTMYEAPIKIGATIMTIILNYVASKCVIFKDNEGSE